MTNMETTPSTITGPHRKFSWRATTSVLIASSFLILLLSGLILFVSPPGRVANWTNWSILGLRKHDWTALHIWFSTLFLVVTGFHVFFNWRPLLNYFRDRISRQIGFRREWIVAFAICGGVYGGTRAGVPPFSTLLSFNESLKESWDKPKERAPIPHAELLSLQELAEKAGVEMTVVTNRLKGRDITNFSPNVVVQKLADDNHRSAQSIYEAIQGQAEPTKSGSGHSSGQGRGKGGGAGGGPGWKTLTQYCTDEGIDLKDALAKLHLKGIKATPEQTMREIAANNGYNRPYELIDILKAK